MKKIETLLLLTAITAFGQATPPVPKQKVPLHHDASGNKEPLCGPNGDQPCAPGGAPPPQLSNPPFTKVEQVLVKEIQARHDELQQLVNEFLDEVRRAHPGYEFRDGSIVPVPPAPKSTNPKEEKKP